MHQPSRHEVFADRLGGVAALYLGFAYLVAMPYYLLVSRYPRASDVEGKVAAIVADYPGLYATTLVTYVLFGLVLGVLVLSLTERLRRGGMLFARVATGVGMTWSVALVLSGMVFNHGMGAVLALARANPAEAAQTWRAVEAVADALGGASGETLGGAWMLLVAGTTFRAASLPRALVGLGVLAGLAGLTATVPTLRDAALLFGLLQMPWFFWLGAVLLRSAPAGERVANPRRAGDREDGRIPAIPSHHESPRG